MQLYAFRGPAPMPFRMAGTAQAWLLRPCSPGHIPGASIWQFRIDGELVPVNVKGPVSADSADMLLKLAIAGAGIIRQATL